MRRAQANCSWLIELGNGDKFVFDFGSGSQVNFTALEMPHQDVTAYFATHLHADHVGDFAQVWVGSWTGGHTAPEEAGQVLAAVYHFFNDFDTAGEIEREISQELRWSASAGARSRRFTPFA